MAALKKGSKRAKKKYLTALEQFGLPELVWVKFHCDPKYKKYFKEFKEEQVFLLLGEISKQPGHCVVIDLKGKIHIAYHTDNFIPLTEEEI